MFDSPGGHAPQEEQPAARQSGVVSPARAFSRSERRNSRSIPASTNSHGSGSRGSRSRRYSSGSTPSSSNARFHASGRNASVHASNRAPFRNARAITPGSRSSPREKTPSSAEVSGEWNFTSAWRFRPSASRSRRIRSWISSRPIWRSHWNGVCGFGTKAETLTVTEARFPWRRAIAATRPASAPMARTSSAVSPGRPTMK